MHLEWGPAGTLMSILERREGRGPILGALSGGGEVASSWDLVVMQGAGFTGASLDGLAGLVGPDVCLCNACKIHVNGKLNTVLVMAHQSNPALSKFGVL